MHDELDEETADPIYCLALDFQKTNR